LFTDPEIDDNNFLNITISSMEDIPSKWAEHLSSSTVTETKDSKKSKKKQEPVLRHWLKCQCVLFPEHAPSLSVHLTFKGTATEIPVASSDNPDAEMTETTESSTRYRIDWNYESKQLVSGTMMKALIKQSQLDEEQSINPVIKITHQFEELDENENVVIKDDPYSVSGELPIRLLFAEKEVDEIIKLNGRDIDPLESRDSGDPGDSGNDEAARNNPPEPASGLRMKLSFDVPLKKYRETLEKTCRFEDMFAVTEKVENIEMTEDEVLAKGTKKCVDEMIGRLVEEHGKFRKSTSIQQYDRQREKEGFIYHLNASGVYREIKDKLVRPQIIRYLEANSSWNTMFTEIISSMIRDLSGAVALDTLKSEGPTEEENRLFVTKNTQIAGDFEITDMVAKAQIHYELAYQRGKEMGPGVQWMTVQNLTKILQRQDQGDQALNALTGFVRNNPQHHHCLLFLAAMSIESDQQNAKPIVYELCDRHPIPTSWTMKAAYFTLNGQETRGDITFKQAINALQHDLNPNLIQDLFGVLFNLKCVRVASSILDHLQKMEQIDVHFHVHHSKLDALTGRYGTAMSSIQEAIRIDDELADLWAIKGHIEYEAGKVDDAKASYVQYLRSIPGTADSLLPRTEGPESTVYVDQKVMYRLGKMYEERGDDRLSLRTYFEAIEFDPEGGSWLFWYEAGSALFRLKEYKESIHCFEQSNMINNNEPHSWCILALCYLAIDEPKMAIQMMKEALQFGSDRIAQSDLKRISDFGERLVMIGHIESGHFFERAAQK